MQLLELTDDGIFFFEYYFKWHNCFRQPALSLESFIGSQLNVWEEEALSVALMIFRALKDYPSPPTNQNSATPSEGRSSSEEATVSEGRSSSEEN